LLKKVTQPRVPYLGRYLTDLVFTEDAMPLVLANDLIHYWKCKSLAQIVFYFVFVVFFFFVLFCFCFLELMNLGIRSYFTPETALCV
jgi:hypothetical protein